MDNDDRLLTKTQLARYLAVSPGASTGLTLPAISPGRSWSPAESDGGSRKSTSGWRARGDWDRITGSNPVKSTLRQVSGATPVGSSQFSDCAIMDAADDVTTTRVMAPLRTGNDGQTLPCRRLRTGDDRPRAHGIHRDRLFDESVLASLDSRFQMDRAKMGGRGQQNKIDIRGQNVLVRVESDKTPVFRHAIGADRKVLAQFIARGFEPILEHVAQSDDLNARR
jgi:hypothetical protein